jgi:Cof subfamily protein (haloacid dehalogenase superfamily)
VIRLVATDLDGTVLPTAQTDEVAPTFTPRMAETIARVRAAGAHVVAVTARSPRSGAPLARRLGMAGPAICGSGSIHFDLDTDRITSMNVLDPDVGCELIEGLRARFPGAAFAAEQGLAFARESGYPKSFFTPDPHHEGDAIGFVRRGGTTKLAVRHAETPVDDLFRTATELASMRASTELTGGRWVGMLHPEATKGAALAALCARLEIEPHEVVAFGDHLPDASMLRWAGLGVAVANAEPALLALADRVAPSCDEDGVACVLEELLDDGAFATRV